MNHEGVEQMAREAGMLAGVLTRYHHILIRVYCPNSYHEQGICDAKQTVAGLHCYIKLLGLQAWVQRSWKADANLAASNYACY